MAVVLAVANADGLTVGFAVFSVLVLVHGDTGRPALCVEGWAAHSSRVRHTRQKMHPNPASHHGHNQGHACPPGAYDWSDSSL